MNKKTSLGLESYQNLIGIHSSQYDQKDQQCSDIWMQNNLPARYTGPLHTSPADTHSSARHDEWVLAVDADRPAGQNDMKYNVLLNASRFQLCDQGILISLR